MGTGIWRMARRNIGRSPRRTGIVVTAVAVGVLFMKGMDPGPQLLTVNPQNFYAVLIIFLLANLLLLPSLLLMVVCCCYVNACLELTASTTAVLHNNLKPHRKPTASLLLELFLFHDRSVIISFSP